MTFVYGMVIFFLCVGFGLIVFSVFRKENESKVSYDFFQAESVISSINSSIEEADNAMEHLNNLSTDVFKEFEEKYQELLFLYQLIAEKKIDLSKGFDERTPDADLEAEAFETTFNEIKTSKPISSRSLYYNHPRLDDIVRLKNKGLPISEIAKKLNMGQGEVRLIIELGGLG